MHRLIPCTALFLLAATTAGHAIDAGVGGASASADTGGASAGASAGGVSAGVSAGTDGSASAGVSAGGASAGVSAGTGGVSAGGSTGSGGTSAGVSSGSVSTGGVSTGGVSTGGVSTGGAATGGVATGGASTAGFGGTAGTAGAAAGTATGSSGATAAGGGSALPPNPLAALFGSRNLELPLPDGLTPSGGDTNGEMVDPAASPALAEIQGTPEELVEACRGAIGKAAEAYGAVRVEAKSGGPTLHLQSGGFAATVAAGVLYPKGSGYEWRQAEVQCVMNTDGEIVDLV